jgi:hypothetical protein
MTSLESRLTEVAGGDVLENNQVYQRENKMTGQHGGKRPGAGRKRGVPNRRSLAALAEATATGEALPLPVLLKYMRRYEKLADETEDVKTREEYVMKACLLADKAAPYLHAKLSAVTQTVKNERPAEEVQLEAVLRNMSLEDLELVREAARRFAEAAEGGVAGEQGGGGKEPGDKLR